MLHPGGVKKGGQAGCLHPREKAKGQSVAAIDCGASHQFQYPAVGGAERLAGWAIWRRGR